jgi:dihydroneopterin aldolase
MILDSYAVDAVRVRVKKPDVPIAATLEYVGVEIVRKRSAAGGAK